MNRAYGYPCDEIQNCFGHFSIVNGCTTFHRTLVSYESLQEQNYLLTSMVMQQTYWNNYNSYYYPIENEHQIIGDNEVVKRRKLDEPVRDNIQGQ